MNDPGDECTCGTCKSTEAWRPSDVYRTRETTSVHPQTTQQDDDQAGEQ